MAGKLSEQLQEADWKTEKHVPVIEAPEAVRAGEPFELRVSVGVEIPHPNTTEHHIRWIRLFFHPEGEKSSYELGSYEFSAHGESVEGANRGPAYAEPTAAATVKLSKPGTLYALAFCNIHGLWQSAREVKVAQVDA